MILFKRQNGRLRTLHRGPMQFLPGRAIGLLRFDQDETTVGLILSTDEGKQLRKQLRHWLANSNTYQRSSRGRGHYAMPSRAKHAKRRVA